MNCRFDSDGHEIALRTRRGYARARARSAPPAIAANEPRTLIGRLQGARTVNGAKGARIDRAMSDTATAVYAILREE